MAKNRSTSVFYKFLIIFIVLMFVATMLVAGGVFGTGQSAFAAGLESYNSVGVQSLATSYNGGAGTITPTSNGLNGAGLTKADDFSFQGLSSFQGASSQVSFALDKMTFRYDNATTTPLTAFSFESLKEISKTNSTLYNALSDPSRFEVVARLSAGSNREGDPEREGWSDTFLAELVWYDGTGAAISFVSGSIPTGNSCDVVTAPLTVGAGTPQLMVRFKNFAGGEGGSSVFVSITSIQVTFTVKLKEANSITARLNSIVSGQQRKDFAIASDESGKTAYVKSGDVVLISVELAKNGVPFFLGDKYKDVIAGNNKSSIRWVAKFFSAGNVWDKTVDFSDMTNNGIVSETATEQTYRFAVPQNIGSQYENYKIVLQPFLPTDSAAGATLSVLEALSVTLTVDNKAPETPNVLASSRLSQFIAENTAATNVIYFTDNAIGVSFQNLNTTGKNGSKEAVYYTTTSANFPTDAQAPTVQSKNINQDTGTILFPKAENGNANGTYAMAMVTIDEVGNSSSVLSAGFFKKVFHVDGNRYTVNASARLGRHGAISLVSDNTAYGIYKIGGEQISSKTFLRGQTVVMTYLFTPAVLNRYNLSNVFFREVSGRYDTAFQLPDGTKDANNNTVMEFSFVMDIGEGKDYITNQNSRNFLFEFKRHLMPEVSNTNTTFTYTKRNGTIEAVPQTINVGRFYYFDGTEKKYVDNITSRDYSVFYGSQTIPDGEYNYGSAAFSAAGNYSYKITLNTNADYFCTEIGNFIIKKADAGVKYFTIKGTGVANGHATIEYATPNGLGAFILLSGKSADDKILSDIETSIGLRGKFVITNPVAGSSAFLNPTVGLVTLNIEFWPEVADALNGVMNDNNFERTRLNATVEVVKRDLAKMNKMEFDFGIDGNTNIVYSGGQYNASLKFALLAEFGVAANHITYTYRAGVGDFGTIAPISAGRYTVRAVINDTVANYSGVVEKDFEIVKQTLVVESTKDTPTEYVYGYFKDTTVIASLKNAETGQSTVMPIERWTYLYRVFGVGEYTAVRPLNAAKYEIKVAINDPNYAGEIVIINTIRPVKLGDSGLTIINPSVQQNPDLGAHTYLNFGMPLSSILLLQGSVMYTMMDGTRITVGGAFEKRVYNSGNVLIGGESYVPTAEDIKVSNKFNFTFGFIPTAGTDFATNFSVLEKVSNVDVSPASIDFSTVQLLPIAFGKTLQEILTTKTGNPTFQRYNAATGLYEAVAITNGVYNYLGTDIALTAIPVVKTYPLPFHFLAATGEGNLYRTTAFNLTLVVTPNEQELYVTNGVTADRLTALTTNYGVKPNLAGRIFVASGLTNLKFAFKYFKTYTAGVLSNPITTDITWQTVGDYFIEIYIDNLNYSGHLVLPYHIQKHQLIKGTNFEQFPLALNNLEWNNSTFAYQQANNMAGSLRREDSDFRGVSGTFRFINDATFAAPGQQTVRLGFVPTDGTNYLGCEFDYQIMVQKRTVTFSYNNTSVYNAAAQRPQITLMDGAVALTAQDATFALTFTAGDPILSGAYVGKIAVDATSLKYRGGGDIQYAITPQSVDVTVNIVPEGYPAGTVFVPNYTVSAVGGVSGSVAGEVTFVYKNTAGAVLPAAPSAVGKYTVTVAVGGNHLGTKTAEFVLKPTSIAVDYVEVFYQKSYTQTAEIAPIVAGHNYNYTLMYRLNGISGAYSATVPTNAGRYDVQVLLNENGYVSETVFLNKLLIKPLAVTQILATSALQFEYAFGAPTLTFQAFGFGAEAAKVLKYTLEYATASGVLLPAAPTHAGNYKITVRIDEVNYQGTKTFDYSILRGTDLKNDGTVTIKDIEYKSNILPEDEDQLFVGRGLFRYTTGGKSMTIGGKFSILTPMFSAFSVGEHDITYQFTPTTYDAGGGTIISILEGDIVPIIAVLPFRMVKKVLNKNDFIVTSPTMNGEIAEAKYDESPVGIVLSTKSDFFSPKEKFDVPANAVITYAVGGGVAGTEKPVNVGEYTVTVTIRHANYVGSFVLTLKILQAVPNFILPTYAKTIAIGQTLAMDTIILGEGGLPLGARYASNNLPIDGTFKVKTAVTFDKANRQKFVATFTPTNPNVAAQEVELFAYVYATAARQYTLNPSWFMATEISSYGNYMTSSQINLAVGAVGISKRNIGGVEKFVLAAQNGQEEIYGTLRLASEQSLFGVGDANSVPVYFMPDEASFGTYQIATTNIVVTVQNKATVAVSGNKVYAVVTAGQSYATATFQATLSVTSGCSAGVSLVPPLAFRFAAGFDINQIVPINSVFPTTTVQYEGGKNFAGATASYPVEFVYLVKETSITVQQRSTEFRLNKQNAQSLDPTNRNSYLGNTLGLTFSGTGDGTPRYTLNVVGEGGLQLVNDPTYGLLLYEAGRYKVTIVLDQTSGFYGQKTIDFVVTKRDISAEIRLNGNKSDVVISKTYLEPYSLLVNAYSPTIVPPTPYDVDFTLKFKNVNGGEYTSKMPMYAGEYIILAEVDSSSRYTGAKEFKLSIAKKTIEVWQGNLTYTYGTEVSRISPKIEGNITAWSYQFTDKSGNTIYNQYPQNAGVYLGKVVLTDSNYQGFGTFDYTIKAAEVAVTWPQFNPLTYGQTLAQSVVAVAGSAVVTIAGAQLSAEGVFGFEEPNSMLNAGQRAVKMRFIPQNSNYCEVTSTVQVVIQKANITISIGQTEFQYSGNALDLKSIYAVYPSVSIVPQYTIRKNDARGEIVAQINAVGVYFVEFKIDTDNYSATKSATITMRQGTADLQQVSPPTASQISYGQILQNSSLSGGEVLYGGKKVYGRFRFLQPQFLPENVGDVLVAVIFEPDDSVNYASYSGYSQVPVKVSQARVEINIDDTTTTSVYGTTIVMPKFSVTGITATFQYVIEGELSSWIGTTHEATTTTATVKIVNQNYTGERVFTYTILKKQINIDFFSSAVRDSKVETYHSVFGENFIPFPGLRRAELLPQDIANLGTLNNGIYVDYLLPNGTYSKTQPKNVGDNYYVSARFDGTNYNGTAQIRYSVLRAKVAQIAIDTATLNKQTYGSVVAPQIITSPAGVGFVVDYGNGAGMPQLAGSYSIKVIISDPNYERTEKSFVFIINPKKLTITNIVVKDKPYDGVSVVAISGKLSGLMLGDEVSLNMTARTVGNRFEAGEYGVEILTTTLGGRHASNYVVAPPQYDKTVKIMENRVEDKASGSYIVFSNNMSIQNVTVEFKNAVSAQNKESVFSALLGQKAQVISFSIKTDGIKTDLSQSVKVYVKIPDRFKNAKNLTFEGVGAMAQDNIVYKREGDYVTFFTARSGEIVFQVSDFPYGIILVSAGFAVLLIGILAVVFFDPVRKRKAKKYKMRDDIK